MYNNKYSKFHYRFFFQGFPGLDGFKGQQGNIGYAGLPGQRGPRGMIGEQGDIGWHGVDGIDGAKGGKGNIITNVLKTIFTKCVRIHVLLSIDSSNSNFETRAYFQ